MNAEEKYFASINYEKTVLRGPFKGMIYPALNSYYSEMAPKIIGCYESELNSIIEDISKKKYTDILDVGCAEGYYAVGLAMKLPDAKIIAYDIQQEAINLCKDMAKKNNVSDHIRYEGFCDSETLRTYRFSGRGLVISDCEGYELELFKKDSITNLKNCDVLIELHDLINPEISKTLINLFKDTHHITIVNSEIRNPKDYPELKKFDDFEQKLILSECRDGIIGEKPMQWAYMVAK